MTVKQIFTVILYPVILLTGVFSDFVFLSQGQLTFYKKKTKKKAKMLKSKFNWIDSIVQEKQEVNLMINFLLQLKLNLNISLSCLQV